MLLYSLGTAPWTDVQAMACALAQLDREGLILSRAVTPCVCVGGQVDVDRDIDSAFCREHKIPIFRRESRNGTICLAHKQLELQVIIPRADKRLAATHAGNSRQVLRPILDALRQLGLPAIYKAPAEIVVKGRRIAAACVGQLHEHRLLAASLTLDFSPELFARALNLKDDRLRERVQELARLHRTSLLEELGSLPAGFDLESRIAQECTHWGELRPGAYDQALKDQLSNSAAAMFAPERVPARERPANGWRLDIGAGLELQQCVTKIPGGFLRATSEWRDGRIVRACLSGDFFCYPPGALFQLEDALVGVGADQIEIKLGEFYNKLGLVTPGIRAAHWARVLDPRGFQG